MRRAFLRELGITPGAYRSRFRTTGIDDGAVDPSAGWPATVHRIPVAPPA